MPAYPPSDPDQWRRQYSDLLTAHSERPSDELLHRAADLGHGLGQARVPLGDLAAAHMAALEELTRQHSATGPELVAAATPLFSQVMEAYEQALRAERDFSAGIIAGTSAIVCGIAPDGATTFLNPAGQRATGYSNQELLGRNWWQTFYPGDEYRQVEELFRAFGQGDVRDYEMVLTTRDGKRRTISWNSINRFDQDGNLLEIIGVGNDITERKQAEEALRESEERFRTVVDASKDAMIAIDPKGLITVFNPAAEEMFGRRKGNMLGQLLNGLMPAEYRERHQQYVSGFFTVGEPRGVIGKTVELPALRSNGEVFPVELSLSSGQRFGEQFVLAVIRDITERKRAEEDLRKFKTISDQAAYGAAISDLDGKMIYLNNAFAKMHGYQPEELLGRHLSIFHTKEQRPHVNALNTRLKREGSYIGEEVWHARRDGGVFPTLMNATIITDENNTPAFLSATAIDITERKQAEAALRESEAKFRSLAENAPNIIVITDRKGTIQFINRTVIEATPEEEIGKSIYDYIEPEFHDLAREAIEHVFQTGKPGRFENLSAGPGGTTSWYDTQVGAITHDGQVAAATLIITDITDRKRTEAAARQHQEQLAHVARVSTMGEMASGLAHELAQPLSAILYYAQSCKSRLRAGAWGAVEAANAMRKIATQAERAGEFIRRLKAFVRKAQPDRVLSDINTIIQEALGIAAPEAREHGVKVRLELSEALPRVVVDTIQIEQVILNLVRNGIEAMAATPSGARELLIRTAPEPDGAIGVSVRDSGPGLPPEVAEQVFDPFFTTKPAGTGLGLSISRSIIEAHEGMLWVKTGPEEGTVFIFTLPAAQDVDHDGN